MPSYRDRLAARGYKQPATVQRTTPLPGDVVLHSWAKPAEKIQS